MPNYIKLLFALNALFFLALVGMFVYTMPRFRQQSQVNPQLGQNPAVAHQTAPIDVTVGDSTNTPDAMKKGQVTQINGITLTIKDHASGQAYTVSTNAKTDIEQVGQQKSQADYQKEMTAYNAKVQQLMQDPVKNKAALESLALPTPVEMKQITLASLQVGDAVEVTAASNITGTSFTAVRIVKAPQTQAAQQ